MAGINHIYSYPPTRTSPHIYSYATQHFYHGLLAREYCTNQRQRVTLCGAGARAIMGVCLSQGRRADLYAGYSHVQDTGDGRGSPTGSGFGPDIPEFQRAQTFPLKFQSPLARLSVKITNRIRWNVGYQYYGYREDFFKGQPFTTDYGYRAQTGYTSVLWSF